MSRKKTVWVRIGKIAALVIPVVLLILLFPVNDYDDSVRIRNFYLETPNSLDVVVMGSSEDYAGYSPVLAYEEYGFTSYPYPATPMYFPQMISPFLRSSWMRCFGYSRRK